MADDDDLTAEISRLEAEIERLAGVAESCRKIVLAAKVVIAIGGVLLLASIFGLITFDQRIVLGSLAAILAGIVVFGSNVGTLRQATSEAEKAQALRSELISRIDFAAVIDSPT